jgi:hypothetical protein
MLNENCLVSQSNTLINSRYQLTEIEQKLIRTIISMIQPRIFVLKDSFYRLDVSSFAHLLGRKDQGTSLFKDMHRVLKKLNETPITLIKPNGYIIKTTWIAAFQYPPISDAIR